MAEQSVWQEPPWYPLPEPHDGVAVQVFMYRESDDTFEISYRGKPSELIASGAVPAVALQPYNRSVARVDDDGDAVRIYHGSLKRGGRIMLLRHKSPSGAAKLRGITAEMLRQAQEIVERLDRTNDERNEARYRAEELAIKSLRSMPAKGFPSTEEALRYLADLRDLLWLAKTRRGTRAEIVACLADQISLSQTVRLLDNLPKYEEASANRDERGARHLRLVVDNTRKEISHD
jgi:hypothetical protein